MSTGAQGAGARWRRAVAARQWDAAAYLAGWALVGALPERLAYRLARWAGAVAARRADNTQLRKNLARPLSVDPAQVTQEDLRAAWQSYARYWVEAFRLPRLVRGAESGALAARLERSIRGVEHLDAARAAGRGVIIVLTHSGNWDMAGVWLVGHAGGFTTVAERLRPEVLFDAFVDYRTSLGFEVLGHTGSAVPVMDTLAERLRAGGIVCLLGERDLSGRGVAVPLLGETAHVPTGAARLHRDTGAVVLTADVFFTPPATRAAGRGVRPGWGMEVRSPVEVADPSDITAMTAAIMAQLGEGLRRHPHDWHMLQPVFDADVDQDRLAARRARADVPEERP
ncbi:phosphatidylinositol mannoside acyltransferase [Corynebacterium sp. 13CS0277]|uniref:phosphatidylinositol mannoside acyltransferase n=1 Tax=Corynebacterium sp. 13CS0277 TaxID=2071994 RepID=UPI000D033831|nr:phosphatidylinositol mannoside acyltransferase [Corynebacterium sp. 13CS0277]PRQ11984.1 phosphatidylinositol mannoside acyltransferase [Corynebacterium sp. 13CS0277]